MAEARGSDVSINNILLNNETTVHMEILFAYYYAFAFESRNVSSYIFLNRFNFSVYFSFLHYDIIMMYCTIVFGLLGSVKKKPNCEPDKPVCWPPKQEVLIVSVNNRWTRYKGSVNHCHHTYTVRDLRKSDLFGSTCVIVCFFC